MGKSQVRAQGKRAKEALTPQTGAVSWVGYSRDGTRLLTGGFIYGASDSASDRFFCQPARQGEIVKRKK